MIAQADEARAISVQNQAVIDLYRQPGFQLVVAILQTVEKNALDAIRAGGPQQTTDRAVGRISAVEEIRKYLLSMLPADTEVQGLEGEEEIEIDSLYSSSFNIPHPSG